VAVGVARWSTDGSGGGLWRVCVQCPVAKLLKDGRLVGRFGGLVVPGSHVTVHLI
jgi:hypothetical protein